MAEGFSSHRHLLVLGYQCRWGRRDDANDIGKAPTSLKKSSGLQPHEQSIKSTPMPPPRHLLAPRLPGFICRSCLSRLEPTRKQRPPWLIRNATTKAGPSQRGNKPPGMEEEKIVRYFDETPDGDRREVPEYGEEEAFLDSMSAEMEEMNAKHKEILGPEKYAATAEEDMAHAIEARIDEEEDTRDITMATNDLENLISRIKALSDKEVVTEEDKMKIREILFNIKPNPEILKFRKERDSRSFENWDPEDGKVPLINSIFPIFTEQYSRSQSIQYRTWCDTAVRRDNSVEISIYRLGSQNPRGRC
jgi:hypothetical protein